MKKVIIAQRAYLQMLTEVYERVETETGGILLGHRDGDTWYVLESVEPGPKSVFTPSYFEYDDGYVNYRANKVKRLYKCSLELLGLWHRHPGLLKTFSSTDDGTNKTYTDMLQGAISGLVTLGNGFEITMYYVPADIKYEKIQWIVDDKQIPQEYLGYYDTDYYQKLLEEAVGHLYVQKHEVASKNVNQYNNKNTSNRVSSNRRRSNDISNENEPISYGSRHHRFFGRVVEKVVDGISLLFEEPEEEHFNKSIEVEEENDIAIIFDTIESEIEYLQQLEKSGNVHTSYKTATSNKGKKILIVDIEDYRQGEEYRYRIKFFVNKDGVIARDEDGNNQVYKGNSIKMLLGGKA